MTAFTYNQVVELQGQVVHTYPQGDFDIASIDEHNARIVAAASSLDRWVLYEHTAVNAGLTTTSIVHLFAAYTSMADHGCQGVAIGGDSIFLKIIPQYIPKNFLLPIKVTADEDEISAFIETLLAG